MNKPKPPLDLDENPEWSEADFRDARPASELLGDDVAALLVRKPGRPAGSTKADPKQQIALRLDRDVVERFKAGGPGWQTRMNDALRAAAGL
ncbi:BrnA antitoxin family protein [Blastomonas sp.]|uniref:BrnA antitoxin family protein n=1 Tax=Blastomonas sp. TaxID=1909299 RepID=UPI0035942402